MLDDINSPVAAPPAVAHDDMLFDAYSTAVMSAVETAGPAVVHIGVRKNGAAAGVGSGLVVASDGLILTNSHVVSGASHIEASMADGQPFSAPIPNLQHRRFPSSTQRRSASDNWRSPSAIRWASSRP
jgi:S1-C subfamily serine protease